MVDDRNNACRHVKLAADPEANTGGHADGFGIFHQSLDILYRKCPVGLLHRPEVAVVVGRDRQACSGDVFFVEIRV